MPVKFNFKHNINLYEKDMISQLTYILDSDDDNDISFLEGERIVYDIVDDYNFKLIASLLNVVKITEENNIKTFHWNLHKIFRQPKQL